MAFAGALHLVYWYCLGLVNRIGQHGSFLRWRFGIKATDKEVKANEHLLVEARLVVAILLWVFSGRATPCG